MKQLELPQIFKNSLVHSLWVGWVALLGFFILPAYGHLAGITDTSIQIGLSKIKVVYTLPDDNLAEIFPSENLNEMIPGILMEPIAEGFVIHNNQVLCPLVGSDTRPLVQVQSRQFILFYQCDAELDVVDIEYRLFVNEYANHENFTRISMGGKHINFVFAANQSTTQIPVKVTVASWGGTLTDDFAEDPNQSLGTNPTFGLSQSLGIEAQPNYFPLGVEHILLGFDHLLFLFALLLLPLKWKQLLLMITSFTVAHSITLAMAVFGWVVLPSLWVEAAIALSIVYVGVENLWETKGYKRTGQEQQFHTRWQRRVAVTFSFGLIHGFGFSYVLKEIGLGDQVASALLFFNLGVEAGQLLAVVVVFPILLWIYRRWPALYFSKVCSVLVVAMGSYWLVERLSGI